LKSKELKDQKQIRIYGERTQHKPSHSPQIHRKLFDVGVLYVLHSILFHFIIF